MKIKNPLKKLNKEPPLGWAQLNHKKVRLLVALIAIAFADIIIFTMLGFKMAFYDGFSNLHKQLRGDLFLVSNRAESLLDNQTFSRRHLYQAGATNGVASANPLYFSFGDWVNPWENKIYSVAVIAFDPARPVVVMGFATGVVIVYEVLHSDVNDHLAEYATLKAMGYSDRNLLGVVFQEAIILAVLGFIPGFIGSIGIYALLGSLIRIPIAIRPDVALRVFSLTVSMCIAAGAIAMRKLQSADPADVF